MTPSDSLSSSEPAVGGGSDGDCGSALEIELTGHTKSSNYLSVGHPALLTAVARDEFEIAGPREDRLHIDRDAQGAIIGITINPGLWPVRATRK